ncbi:DUF3105 domain-containing protein [Patescibacteria group bacterium]|nr:DUF3105 domain-containing protein [Patescibacteria group bacterium]
MKNIKTSYAIIAVFVLLVGGIWLSNGFKKEQTSGVIEGLKQYTLTEREHVQGEVAYAENPPVGGKHAQVWVACNGNVYDKPVIKEQAVHALEHGAVWITYQPTLSTEQIEMLKKKVRGYTFLSPLAEQNTPIVLTAWNNQLFLESEKDPRIDLFINKFRQGPQTPEPGATCSSVPGGMS